MSSSTRLGALLVVACIALAGCGGGGVATGEPPGSTPTPIINLDPTAPPAAGEPCSFLSAAEVGEIVGQEPVEVAERAGRGDCDYWLTAARDEKVNIGVTTGPDALALFDSTKALGTPEPAAIGDEAYSIQNEGLGAIVVAKKGDAVVVVQALFGLDADEQLADAIAVAQAVVAKL